MISQIIESKGSNFKDLRKARKNNALSVVLCSPALSTLETHLRTSDDKYGDYSFVHISKLQF